MKKMFLLSMAVAVCAAVLAYDKATTGTEYFGSNCKAVGQADGTVAIVEYYIPDVDADKTALVFPATIEIWSGEPSVKTAEYEVSTIGGGWTMWVKLGEENKLTTMTAITIPEGVKTIGQSTFYGATALKEVALPTTLESISSYAFGGCGALTKIICKANSAPALGDDVFKYSDGEWDKTLKQAKVYVPSESAKATYNTTDWSYWKEWYNASAVIVDPAILTAIDNTAVETKVIKTFENGQLIIIKNGVKYNVNGTKL